MIQPELPGLDGSRPQPGLSVRGPGGRHASLLAEHRKLLDRVARQRERLRRLHEELRTQGARMAAVLEPLRERLQALDAEVHGLFAELLAPDRLPRAARRQVAMLFEFLQREGVLSPGARREPDGDAPRTPPPADPVPPRPEGSGSRLRELFLDLANALHPDKAQGSSDLSARTEAMKEVNRAYRDGDLARLLELERSWTLAQAAPATPDEAERRCQALERTNRELRAQVKQLAREEVELRRSELARLLQAGKRLPVPDPLATLEAEGREHIEKLTQLRDLVRRFSDGDISLDALLAGPEPSDEDEAEADVLVELAQIAIELERRRHPVRRRRR